MPVAATKTPDLPMAYLSGVLVNPGEPAPCSLVFELETEAGGIVQINYSVLLDALRFAQREAIIPPLPEDWWARTGEADGRSF